jgi:hypothetical protein
MVPESGFHEHNAADIYDQHKERCRHATTNTAEIITESLEQLT